MVKTLNYTFNHKNTLKMILKIIREYYRNNK